jgi:outer membrane protein OmpA-like peptidoglycan-associated protein
LQGPIDIGHLHFSSGSAALSNDAKIALNEIALQMMQSNLTAAYLVGTTDRVGSASSGMTLSLKRVNAAAAYLKSRLVIMGITNAVITTENMGEYLSNSKDGSANPEDRKVTVTIYPNFS